MHARVEEMLDEVPLLVRQVDNLTHTYSLPVGRDSFYDTDELSVRR